MYVETHTLMKENCNFCKNSLTKEKLMLMLNWILGLYLILQFKPQQGQEGVNMYPKIIYNVCVCTIYISLTTSK